jgi:hypothetical protein
MMGDTPLTDAADGSYESMAQHARKMERAASYLLEACREAIDAGNDGDWQSAKKALQAAIAKALGADSRTERKT